MEKFSSTKAILLNGTDEFFTISDSSNLSFGNGTTDSAFSISAFIYMADATNFNVISKQDRSVGGAREYVFQTEGIDTLVFRIYDGTVSNYLEKQTPALTSYQYKWTHVCCTYSGSSSLAGMKIYVNGAEFSTTSTIIGTYVAMENTSVANTIGNNGAVSPNLYSNGYISRVVVWNKQLSLSEIKEDMTIGDLNWHSAKSNIVSWWEAETFDGTTMRDRKGGNNATASNMDSSNRVNASPYPRRWQTIKGQETPFDKFGGMAWDLDGTNEYIEIADNENLSFGNGTTDSAFSVSAWANMNDATRFIFLSKDNVPTQREYFFYTNVDDKLACYLIDQSTGGSIARAYDTALTGYQGQWIHVAMTYSGNSLQTGIKLYLNGVRVDDTNLSTGSYTAMKNGTYQNFIGRAWSTYSNGRISDTIVYNKELSATEVTQIYNAGQPRDETKTNISNKLVYYRPYNSSVGSNGVLDQSGNAINGSLINIETTDIRGGYRNYPVKIYDNTNKSCFNFGGTNEYASNSSFSINGFSAFTMSIWYKNTSATLQYLFSMPESSGGSGGCDLYMSSGRLQGSIKTSTYTGINTGVTSNDDKWHCGVITYDGANLRIYQDGVFYSAVAKTGTVSLTANETNFGRFGSYGAYYIGRLNHASVCNKGLTNVEVEEMYNNGTPPDLTKVSFSSAVTNWWKFNNNDSATGSVSDAIGSATMTCNNMESGDKETTNYPT